jgi:hypothetical protein
VLIVRKFGASTSWNPKGLSRPVEGYLYLYLHEDRYSSIVEERRCRNNKIMSGINIL